MKKWILRVGITLWLLCSVFTLGVSFLPGRPGLHGITGEKGDVGAVGKIGLRGKEGSIGLTGFQGEKGVKGEKGDKGATGLWGLRGPQGLQGEKGYSVDLPKLYKQISPAVVWIGAEVERYCSADGFPDYIGGIKWQGSGFFVTPCLIATAGHVVEGTKTFEVQFQDGSRAKADFIHMENIERCDVGFIQLRKEYRKERPYLEFGLKVEIGESLIILGHPWGLNKGITLTHGIISLIGRDESYFGTKLVMHTDTSAWPGNSGSPVVNMNGKCVGILIGGMTGYDNFSIVTPAKLVKLAMQKALAEVELREVE